MSKQNDTRELALYWLRIKLPRRGVGWADALPELIDQIEKSARKFRSLKNTTCESWAHVSPMTRGTLKNLAGVVLYEIERYWACLDRGDTSEAGKALLHTGMVLGMAGMESWGVSDAWIKDLKQYAGRVDQRQNKQRKRHDLIEQIVAKEKRTTYAVAAIMKELRVSERTAYRELEKHNQKN